MNKYTIEDVTKLSPCDTYTTEVMERLWNDKESLSLLEICELDIPIEDIIWVATKLMSERDARLFECDCADHVLPIFETKYTDNKRLRECIEISRRYAKGETTEEELTAAVSAAYWVTDSAAAWAAYWAAYSAADSGAASAAASAAERKWQLEKLKGYCKELENGF